MRSRSVLIATFCAVGLAGCSMLKLALRPLAETTLIRSFDQHRALYERLRDMLLSDKQLSRVADWGVETTDSPIVQIPPNGAFPVQRYREYVALLKAVDAEVAFRPRDVAEPRVCVLVWGSGFGGDTRHQAVCWVEGSPAHQTQSLDAYYRSPKPRQPVFRHIDSNWYLWADW